MDHGFSALAVNAGTASCQKPSPFKLTMSEPITFLFPAEFLAQDLPNSLNGDWSKCGGSCHGTIYATFVALREKYSTCRVAATVPERGIVIGHPLTLARHKPIFSKQLYIVCWQQDYPRCDWAHMHIVMNTGQLPQSGLPLYDRLLWPGPRQVLHYIPEPKLTPRDASRGTTFENLGFMGEPKNLLPELQSEETRQKLEALGCRLCMHVAEHTRSDYSQIDAVLAIRPSRHELKQKSPHKLWNAWRAGVPAILGPEPGFHDYRRSELDYLEARTVAETLAAIEKLKHNPELRQAMVENGMRRAEECSVTTLITEWQNFIDGALHQCAGAWFAGPAWRRQAFRLARSVRIALRCVRQSHRQKN